MLEFWRFVKNCDIYESNENYKWSGIRGFMPQRGRDDELNINPALRLSISCHKTESSIKKLWNFI